jgi:hypothetical protein
VEQGGAIVSEGNFKIFGCRSAWLLVGLTSVIIAWPSGFSAAQDVCQLRSATAGEISWHDRILSAFRAAASSAPKAWRIQKESAYIPDYSDSGGKPQVCVGWDKDYFPATPSLKRVYISMSSKKSSAVSSEKAMGEQESGKKMGDLSKQLEDALRQQNYAQASVIEKQMQAFQTHAQNQVSKAGRFAASLRLMANDQITILKEDHSLHIPGAAFAFRQKDSSFMSIQTRTGPLMMTGDSLTLLLGAPMKSVYVNGKVVKDQHWIREKIYNISVVIEGNEATINELLKGLNLAKLNALISK